MKTLKLLSVVVLALVLFSCQKVNDVHIFTIEINGYPAKVEIINFSDSTQSEFWNTIDSNDKPQTVYNVNRGDEIAIIGTSYGVDTHITFLQDGQPLVHVLLTELTNYRFIKHYYIN